MFRSISAPWHEEEHYQVSRERKIGGGFGVWRGGGGGCGGDGGGSGGAAVAWGGGGGGGGGCGGGGGGRQRWRPPGCWVQPLLQRHKGSNPTAPPAGVGFGPFCTGRRGQTQQADRDGPDRDGPGRDGAGEAGRRWLDRPGRDGAGRRAPDGQAYWGGQTNAVSGSGGVRTGRPPRPRVLGSAPSAPAEGVKPNRRVGGRGSGGGDLAGVGFSPVCTGRRGQTQQAGGKGPHAGATGCVVA